MPLDGWQASWFAKIDLLLQSWASFGTTTPGSFRFTIANAFTHYVWLKSTSRTVLASKEARLILPSTLRSILRCKLAFHAFLEVDSSKAPLHIREPNGHSIRPRIIASAGINDSFANNASRIHNVDVPTWECFGRRQGR